MSHSLLRKMFGTDMPEHKSAQITEMKADDSLKIIGVGLPRTGTSSLKIALEILGFGPCHHMSVCIEQPERSIIFTKILNTKNNPRATTAEQAEATKSLKDCMRGYVSTVDGPGCDVYLELATLYPDAKLILTARDTDEQWWKSFVDTIGVQRLQSTQILMYPLRFARELHRLCSAFFKRWEGLPGVNGVIGSKVHSKHNQLVRDTVPKERLLEYNVKMGWPKLCEFLEVPVPEVPFPNANDTKKMQRAIKGGLIMGACAWLFYIGLVGASLFLLTKAMDRVGG